MKVFGAKRTDGYSGGVILVAANSIEEAIVTASKNPETEYMFHWEDEYFDTHVGNFEFFSSDYYPKENWKEIENLMWNGDEPQVIIEGGYTE